MRKSEEILRGENKGESKYVKSTAHMRLALFSSTLIYFRHTKCILCPVYSNSYVLFKTFLNLEAPSGFLLLSAPLVLLHTHIEYMYTCIYMHTHIQPMCIYTNRKTYSIRSCLCCSVSFRVYAEW